MANDNVVWIEGLEEFIKDLNKYGKEAEQKMIPYVDKGGDQLLTKVKTKVPVRLGNLKRSLYLKRPKPKNLLIRNWLTWHDDVRDYAAPVEFGHQLIYFGKRTNKWIAPQPYLRPGADESADTVLGTMIKGVDKTLESLSDKG